MAKIEFTKADKVNGHEYKKGDVLKVSESIYKTLNENGSVKDFTVKKAKSKKED